MALSQKNWQPNSVKFVATAAHIVGKHFQNEALRLPDTLYKGRESDSWPSFKRTCGQIN